MGERWAVTICRECHQAGYHDEACPFPGDHVMSAEGDRVEVVRAEARDALAEALRSLVFTMARGNLDEISGCEKWARRVLAVHGGQ